MNTAATTHRDALPRPLRSYREGVKDPDTEQLCYGHHPRWCADEGDPDYHSTVCASPFIGELHYGHDEDGRGVQMVVYALAPFTHGVYRKPLPRTVHERYVALVVDVMGTETVALFKGSSVRSLAASLLKAADVVEGLSDMAGGQTR